MSKAFKIICTDYLDPADLTYEFQLPRVHCDLCGQTWGNGAYRYPTFQFDFLNHQEYSFKNILTVGELAIMVARIQKEIGRAVILVPGASLGAIVGTTSRAKMKDLLWGTGGCPQISRQARALLAADGINLLTAGMKMKCRGRLIDTHLGLQAEPVAMLTEESLLKHQIRHCPSCNDYNSALMPRPKVPEGYRFKAKCWPRGQHLVTVLETLYVLASPEFMASITKHRLEGIGFVECGAFV